MSLPAWRYKKTRACNRYDNRGIPYTSACNRGGDCWFVHPHDPEWSDLVWTDGVGRVRQASKSRSRSRSRSRERNSGWDRKRATRGKGRGRGRDRERSRDRDDSRDRGRRSPRSRDPRRLSPRPPTSRSPQQTRRSSYRDRSPPPLSSTSTSSRPRRDSIASSAGDPPPTTASSAGFDRPRTPPRGPRRSFSDRLLGSPEEQKPDVQELERARLLARAKVAKEQQRRRDLGIPPELIDLSVSAPSATRAISTPTATSPPPPGLTAFKSFTLPKTSTPSTMSISATPSLQSAPPPPLPNDLPPPTPTDTPVSAFSIPNSAMNVDSPATMTPPANPPRPLPDAPDFDDILQDETLVKGSWDARVHLLTDLVELDAEVEGLKEDVETIRNFSGSTMLPEAARARYDERLAQAEEKLQAKQAEYEKLRDENIEVSSVWPIGKEQMERDIKLVAAYKEMVEYLANLTKVTNDLQRELAVLGVGKMPEVPVVDALKEDVEAKLREEEEERKAVLPPPLPSRKKDGDAMEVDTAPPGPPPLPSRSSAAPHTPSTPTTPSTIPPPPPLPHRRVPPPSERTLAQRDVDEILAKLDGIEKEVHSVQNLVVQKENELRDEFKGELENKTDEIFDDLFGDEDGDAGRDDDDEGEGESDEQEHDDEKSRRRRAVKGDPEVEELRKKLEDMMGQTKDSVKEVDEMTEILYNFQTRLEAAEGQLGAAVAEHQGALNRQAELQTRLLALEESHRTSTSTIETLHHTLRAHIASRPPSPPVTPSPPLPSVPLLIAVLRDPLIAELRRAIAPVVEEVRAEVKKRMQEEAGVLYGDVWEKVEPSLRVLGGVERVLRDGGVPVEGHANVVNGLGGGMVNGAASH